MKKHQYYVYILLCADDTFYVGVTNSIKRRYHQHQTSTKETSYTFSRRPLKLVYHEEYKYILNAIAREKQLKGWSRKKKIALINGDFELLSEASKKKFDK